MRFRVTLTGTTDDSVSVERIAAFINDAISEADDRAREDGEDLPGVLGNAVVVVLGGPAP